MKWPQMFVCHLLAVALSFPTADLAQAPFPAYDGKFGPVSYREWVFITIASHMLVATCIASVVAYRCYQIPLIQALGFGFMLAALPFVFGIGKHPC